MRKVLNTATGRTGAGGDETADEALLPPLDQPTRDFIESQVHSVQYTLQHL
jgi:hypothetical protein